MHYIASRFHKNGRVCFGWCGKSHFIKINSRIEERKINGQFQIWRRKISTSGSNPSAGPTKAPTTRDTLQPIQIFVAKNQLSRMKWQLYWEFSDIFDQQYHLFEAFYNYLWLLFCCLLDYCFIIKILSFVIERGWVGLYFVKVIFFCRI